MVFQLDDTDPKVAFPDPALAEKEPDGLLAVGGDLSTERLSQAYSQGVFPWYSEGQPILWWSPDPRMVLYPKSIHISRSLQRLMKQSKAELRIDTQFNQVTRACAAPRATQDGTWILPEMQQAYSRLHQQGIAHSIELWLDGALIGGLYGIALGRVFFGESMFSASPSASRIVMVYLCQLLQQHQFHFLDCQIYNPHLESMGAAEIPRIQFLSELSTAVSFPIHDEIWTQSPVAVKQLDCLQKASGS